MRIYHLADIHARHDRYDEVAVSLRTARDDARANGADLFVLAGDTWDGPVQNTAGARFADFLTLIAELADVAPVVMIYGTPTHDTEGSLEVFEQIQAAHQITILRPGRPYALGTTNADIYDLSAEIPRDTLRLLLFGVPEPNKKWLLANAGATGKDEADEAARSAMRGLFLGLGGMRKEHADLPCILLYHGQVSGAKSGTGYECASGLMASKDDLAMAGADYIALGDIHEPQQIGTMPAYYPGSVYPKDFGETHQAGCNVVYIGDDGWTPTHSDDLFGDPSENGTRHVEVSRLDFPHPQRVHERATWPANLDAVDVAGRVCWLEITATREESRDFDADAALLVLEEAGALPGSRVTLNVLPTETVRAGGIAEKKRLRDKVQVYAENSGVAVSQRVLARADELEHEAASRAAAGSGAYLRVDRLILRGAIGIYKKSRKDEVDLNLEDMGPGVLALVGGNGAGKTTILENLHPWSTLLTRDGTLKDNFRLKDSFRDLYITDERTGWRYRAQILIRADIASGAAEYYLYRDQGDGKGFQPYGGTNGRKEAYDAAVAELFGSLEMFLRTAFITQRPTKYAPDLSAATKLERKTLFAELSGIDYLDGYRLTAKDRADAIDDETRDLRALVQAAAGVDAEIERALASIAQGTADASAADQAAMLSLERGKALKAEREATAARLSALEHKASKKADLERDIAALLKEIDAAEAEIAGFQAAANGKAQAVAELAKFEALDGEACALRADKSGVDEANHAALLAHQQASRAIDTRRREAQTALDDARRRLAAAEQAVAVARAKLAAPVADHCPTCAQLLPAEKRAHLQEERAHLEAEITTLSGAAVTAKAAVDTANLALSTIVQPSEPEPAVFAGADRLHELERSLDWMDPAVLRETIRKADEAAVRIDAAERRRQDATTRRGELAHEVLVIGDVSGDIALARDALTAKDAALESERQTLTGLREQAAAARSTVAAEERALASAEARKSARDAAEAKVAGLADEVADWRFLEKACGPDGIQALELDALAPGIAEIANRLLTASGNAGRIEFRTTRIGGKGARMKQIEDFLVYYIDDAGEEQEIATLSGGESVWVKKALTDAFGIIRARNQGIRFQTVVMDEADGALDPENRMRYLRMLEAAHTESGRYQTILVTHSTELQAMIATIIDVSALTERREKEEVAA